MTKQAFLLGLRTRLNGIPKDDIEGRVAFYEEIIDDRMEEGLTEQQAVEQLGTLERVVKQIMSEIPLTKLVREKVRPGRALRAWEILLLVLGSPIWLSLFIASLAILISVYAVLWSVIVVLWALDASFAVCLVGGAFAAVVSIAQGALSSGLFLLGGGIVCSGLAIFAFFGCKYATIGILKLTKQICLWIKSCFIKKGETT